VTARFAKRHRHSLFYQPMGFARGMGSGEIALRFGRLSKDIARTAARRTLKLAYPAFQVLSHFQMNFSRLCGRIRMISAACTNSVRRYLLPRLDMRPWIGLPPALYWPRQCP
jgi:hypothetical protein